jgi:pimeloyl-ACP methyl ester carboxylesterase
MSPVSVLPGPRGFVESNGEQIYFECWGSGETVVLTHGMGGNHAIWYQQVPVMAAHFRVVTWDQRGFGRSTERTGAIGPEPSADDLGSILDHLEIDRAHLVGQSMGGWASLGFAIARPSRALSLVLADTIGGIFTESIRQAFLDYGRAMAESPAPDQLPLGKHPAVGVQLTEENLAHSFLYSQIGGLGASPSPIAITDLLMATDHTDQLDRLEAPTMFVVGENDPIFSPDIITEAATLIPGSEVKTVANTGHSPYFERPDEWNDLVLRFLQARG